MQIVFSQHGSKNLKHIRYDLLRQGDTQTRVGFLRISLEVVRSAVRVDVLPLYVIRLPPTAILIRLGSSFWGRWSTTIRA